MVLHSFAFCGETGFNCTPPSLTIYCDLSGGIVFPRWAFPSSLLLTKHTHFLLLSLSFSYLLLKGTMTEKKKKHRENICFNYEEHWEGQSPTTGWDHEAWDIIKDNIMIIIMSQGIIIINVWMRVWWPLTRRGAQTAEVVMVQELRNDAFLANHTRMDHG